MRVRETEKVKWKEKWEKDGDKGKEEIGDTTCVPLKYQCYTPSGPIYKRQLIF
jgi:hypothetical protein